MASGHETRSKTTASTTFHSLPLASKKSSSSKTAAVQCTLPPLPSSSSTTSVQSTSTSTLTTHGVLPSTSTPSVSDEKHVATPPSTPLPAIPVSLPSSSPPILVPPVVMADAGPAAADPTSDDRFINVKPPSFSGYASDDAFTFMKAFERYIAWKRITDDDRKSALFAVLLRDNAASWYDTLSATDKSTFTHLRNAFDKRYLSPAVVKHNSARTIFSRKQLPSESTDDFIAAMRRHAQLIEADDGILRYALLSGFRPHIANFVLQQKAESLDDIVEAARLAELTNASSATSDNSVILEQLSQLQADVRRLGRDRSSAVTPSRSPTPEHQSRAVRFAAPPAMGRRPSPAPSRAASTGQSSYSARHPSAGRGRRSWNMNIDASTSRGCLRCGRASCSGMRGECNAFGKSCFRCHKLNHVEKACLGGQPLGAVPNRTEGGQAVTSQFY